MNKVLISTYIKYYGVHTLSRGKGEKMTEKNRIVVYLDQEKTEELKERANKEGRSVSNLIGFIIKQYLEHEHEHEQKGE